MREWTPSVSAVPLRRDVVEQRIELVGAPANDVQHRPENFADRDRPARSSSMMVGAT